MKRNFLIMVTMLLVIVVSKTPAALSFTPPENCGWIDVSKHGVKGDGSTDNTEAIRALKGNDVHNAGTYYFPDGVYLISDEIFLGIKRLILQGQSREGTIIRLKPNSPGYGDVENPKAVIKYAQDLSGGAMGQAFRNSLYSMTIEIGEGNPGAIAVHYINNNQGSIENVTVRSLDPMYKGKAGIAFIVNWPGPALIKNVTVDGFEYGLWNAVSQYSLTFENITLNNQRTAGLYSSRYQKLRVRNLRSQNTVPAVKLLLGDLTLINADLKGGTQNGSAIEHDDANVFVKNCTVHGYGNVVSNKKEVIKGPYVQSYAYNDYTSALNAPSQPLNLPEADAPIGVLPDRSQWIFVDNFSGTDHEKITAALSSKKPVVVFSKKNYALSDPVTIPATVEFILGMDATLAPRNFKSEVLFTISEGTTKPLYIERLSDNYGDVKFWIDHASRRPLVLSNLITRGYKNSVQGGEVYCNDVCGGPWHFRGQKLWARQLNPEEKEQSNIVAENSDLWILGLKTEYGYTVANLSKNSRCEIYGLFTYHEGKAPAFIIRDASLSLVNYSSMGNYSVFLDAIVDGKVLDAPTGKWTVLNGYKSGAQLPFANPWQSTTIIDSKKSNNQLKNSFGAISYKSTIIDLKGRIVTDYSSSIDAKAQGLYIIKADLHGLKQKKVNMK